MKLFYGGYGDYAYFTAARNKAEAIENIKRLPGMAWLPVEAKQLRMVEGYRIELIGKETDEKQEVEQNVGDNDAEPVGETESHT